MKFRQHIPNSITLGNLIFGCLAIYFLLVYQQPQQAFWFIYLALIGDFLDGWIARKLGVSSSLGKDLDSLADGVTFGVFPSFLILHCFTKFSDFEGFKFISLAIAAASIYRLANFNQAGTPKDYFLGLATPANTFFAIGIFYWCSSASFSPLVNGIILIIYSSLSWFLLNAKIPLFSFKNLKKPFFNNVHILIFFFLSLIIFLFLRELAIAPIIIIYILLSLTLKKHFIYAKTKPE